MSATERTATANFTLRDLAQNVIDSANGRSHLVATIYGMTGTTTLSGALALLADWLNTHPETAADSDAATVAAEMQAMIEESFNPWDEAILHITCGQLRRWIVRLRGVD